MPSPIKPITQYSPISQGGWDQYAKSYSIQPLNLNFEVEEAGTKS